MTAHSPDAPAIDLVTVVIPARNEEAFIAECLDSVLGQTYPNLEIVVVDGASTDRTAAIVEEYACRDRRVRLLHNPRAIIPVSLNLGARDARGRWMVRVDAHATVGRDYVEIAIGHLRTGQWGGVGGRVDSVGRTPTGQAVAAVMSSRFGIGNSVHHYGTEPVPADHVPFPAYPVSLVSEIGGWDENLAVNQDFEFDYRLGEQGYRLLYDPALVIHYHCQQSIKGLVRQFRRYGRGRARVVWLHPKSLRARHLVPPMLVASWAGAALLTPRHRRIALASVLPYGAGLAFASIVTARRMDGWRSRLMLPATFVAIHGAWGFGFWQGSVNRLRQSHLLRRAPSTAANAAAASSSEGRVPSSTMRPGKTRPA